MAPPSEHPDAKEKLLCESFDEPAQVEADSLLHAAKLIATCALVSRYYNPSGSRHNWCMALAGLFKNLGVTEDETKKIVTAAAEWARDSKVEDRIVEIHSTYKKGDDDPTTGGKRLKDEMDKGEAFIKSINKIWRIAGKTRDGFVSSNERGTPDKDNQANILHACALLGVALSHDTFARRYLLGYGHAEPQALEDSVVDDLWLAIDSKFKFRPSLDVFERVLKSEARRNPFHPICDYLNGLKWDGTPRIGTWLINHGGAEDTPFNRAVSSIVLIAAVRRARQPGCKYDELLVIISPGQGTDKSTAIRKLCPNPGWFSDDYPLGADAKRLIEQTDGKWILEASDLEGMSKRHVDDLKASLSRGTDGPVRMSYVRRQDSV